jgi:hypothetical protein
VLNFKEMGGQGPISFYFPQFSHSYTSLSLVFLHFSGMKNTLVFIAIISQTCLFGQNSEANLLANQSAAKTVTIDLNDPNLQDWDPFFLVTKEQPKPASDYGLKKELLHQQRLAHINTNTILNDGRSTIAPTPILLENFAANNAQGTPNDNHIAVSNDGKIVSVVNTNFRVYNDAGTQLATKITIVIFRFGAKHQRS